MHKIFLDSVQLDAVPLKIAVLLVELESPAFPESLLLEPFCQLAQFFLPVPASSQSLVNPVQISREAFTQELVRGNSKTKLVLVVPIKVRLLEYTLCLRLKPSL